jgi:hypothetical protein
MGLKGFMLWVMGQLDSNVQSPTAGLGAAAAGERLCRLALRAVAGQAGNLKKAKSL